MRIALALILAVAGTVCAEPLPIYYIEKPPYYYTDQGAANGFLLNITQAIATHAGIAANFQSGPAKRILLKLEQDATPACSIGWFKTEQRAAFAWFSAPIYRDTPMQVLSASHMLKQISNYPTFASLLTSNLRLGLVDGFSYGALDAELLKVRSQKITATPAQIVRMLAAERIDYTLIDAQELPYMLAQTEIKANALTAINFPDIPPGQLRYLMCSHAIGKDIETRINHAIQALGIQP